MVTSPISSCQAVIPLQIGCYLSTMRLAVVCCFQCYGNSAQWAQRAEWAEALQSRVLSTSKNLATLHGGCLGSFTVKCTSFLGGIFNCCQVSDHLALAHREMGVEDSPGEDKSQGTPSFCLFLFAVDRLVFLLREHNTLTERLKSPSLEDHTEQLGPRPPTELSLVPPVLSDLWTDG